MQGSSKLEDRQREDLSEKRYTNTLVPRGSRVLAHGKPSRAEPVGGFKGAHGAQQIVKAHKRKGTVFQKMLSSSPPVLLRELYPGR